MLRIVQLTSAAQAKEYHQDELTRSSYYVDDQELKGAFRGRMAKRLGIEGEVTKEIFDGLCDKLHPFTRLPLTSGKCSQGTVGYDISFHCPKSVSILHILTSDDHILKAFHQSVLDTMQDIEADMQTRVRKDGKNEDCLTGELLYADFIHQTSRPTKDAVCDPHLHCHATVFNLSWHEAEKQYKAAQFRNVVRDAPYYEARFHKRLSDALIELGYRIRPVGKFWEVESIPQQVIDLFSKRTQEINQLAKEKGITDARTLDQLGAKTRGKKKKNLSMRQLKKIWRKQIQALGISDDSGDPIRHAPGSNRGNLTPADCVNHALLHKFERASVVHDRRLLETAYRFGIGHASAKLQEITEVFKRNTSIITIQEGSRLLCTTKEVLAEEQRMVALAVAGKGKMTPLYVSAPDLAIDGDQADAIRHVLTTADSVSIISGKAGTGKTTLLKELNKHIVNARKRMIVAAPTAQASRGVLRDEGFEGAETLAKILSDPELQKNLTGQYFVLDEGGLCGTAEMTAALELAVKLDARLIICGDTRQHSSVTRGDALRVLCKVAGIIPAQVRKIYRQKNKTYKEAVQDLSEGRVKQAFDKLAALESITQIDAADPCERLAADYLAAVKKEKTVLIVSPTHKQGEQVTQAVRQKLRDAGKLDRREVALPRLVNSNMTEAEKTDFRQYKVGQVIRFNQNRTGIRRGSHWRVISIQDGVIIIENDNKQSQVMTLDRTTDFAVYHQTEIGLSKGDIIMVNHNGYDANQKRLNNGQMLEVVEFQKGKIIACTQAKKEPYILPDNYGHLSHAYCITSHASQGKTTDEVFVMQPSATFAASNMQQFYVSVSRAREKVHIYTDDREALLEQVSQSGDRTSALELIAKSKPTMRPRSRNRTYQNEADFNSSPVEPTEQLRAYEPKPHLS